MLISRSVVGTWVGVQGRTDGAARRWVSAYPNAAAYVLDLQVAPREKIVVLETAAQAAGILGDRRGEGIHLGNLRAAYYRVGEVRRAIEHREQALVISREIGDRRGERNRLGNLGAAYAALGETGRARDLWQQALHIFEEIESPHAETERGWLTKIE